MGEVFEKNWAKTTYLTEFWHSILHRNMFILIIPSVLSKNFAVDNMIMEKKHYDNFNYVQN